MNDAAVVRSREAMRDLYCVLNGLAQKNGSAPQPLAQGLTLKQFSDDIR